MAVNGDFRVRNWWFSVFWDKHLIVNGIWGKSYPVNGIEDPLPPLRWITEIQGKSVVFYYYLYQVMFLNNCRTVLRHLFSFFQKFRDPNFEEIGLCQNDHPIYEGVSKFEM